jgi:transposase
VDPSHSRELWPSRFTIPVRCHRRRMAGDRTADPGAEAAGPAARMAGAGDRQRDLLCDALQLPWRLLPANMPPWSTVYCWFAAWRDACVFESLNYALVMTDRERVGRGASPSAAIIDSQSVKTRKPAVREPTTPERRSMGASATPSSTQTAARCCSKLDIEPDNVAQFIDEARVI